MRKEAKEQIVKYTGNGDYLVGIPARDMSLEEWQALSEEQRALGLKLNLYKLADEKPSGGE